MWQAAEIVWTHTIQSNEWSGHICTGEWLTRQWLLNLSQRNTEPVVELVHHWPAVKIICMFFSQLVFASLTNALAALWSGSFLAASFLSVWVCLLTKTILWPLRRPLPFLIQFPFLLLICSLICLDDLCCFLIHRTCKVFIMLSVYYMIQVLSTHVDFNYQFYSA